MLEVIFSISIAMLFGIVVLILWAATYIGAALAISLLIFTGGMLGAVVLAIVLPKRDVASDYSSDRGVPIPPDAPTLRSDRAGHIDDLPGRLCRPAHLTLVRR
jgi:hypothetical protein